MHRARLSAAAVAVGTMLAVGSTTTEAKADWYDDATSIVEQLIEDNIATVAVPNAASRLPVACEFFPSTVYALEAKRYNGIPVIIRKEAADAIGLFVLDKIDPLQIAPGGDPNKLAVSPDSNVTLNAWALQMLKTAVAKPAADAVKKEEGATLKSATATVAAKDKVALSKQKPACSFPATHDGQQSSDAATESKATKAMRLCEAPQSTLPRELGCAAALTVRDAANGDDSLLPSDVRRLAAAVVLEEASAGAIPAGVTLQNAMSALQAALSGTGSEDDLAASVCSAIGFPSTSPPTAAYTACASALKASAAWARTRNLRLDASTLEKALGLVAGIAQTCADHKPALPESGVCSIIETLATDSERVIEDVQSKNFGAAAGSVLGVVEQIKCEDADGFHDDWAGCSKTDQAVYGFLQALAVFSVDSLTSGKAPASADSDFRKAAVDLIEATSGAGVRRTLWHAAYFLWVPEFALRDAWRPGHVGTSPGELMIYPSIDLIRFRLRPIDGFRELFLNLPPSQNFFLGIQVSVLDPLGPIMEGSTRDGSLRTSANATNVFWWGFIVPRLDVEIALPQLSKNLVVGAGGAFRFFRAEGSPGSALYCVVGSDCTVSGVNEGKSPSAGNFEASVFVKYVP